MKRNSECLGRNIMEAKVIVYNVVIKPGRVFSALLALLHGFLSYHGRVYVRNCHHYSESGKGRCSSLHGIIVPREMGSP